MVRISTLLFLIACASDIQPDEYLHLLGQWKDFDQKIETANMDDTTHDLLLLELAIRSPQHSTLLCKRVKTTAAIEKCQQVIGRPHLSAPSPKP